MTKMNKLFLGPALAACLTLGGCSEPETTTIPPPADPNASVDRAPPPAVVAKPAAPATPADPATPDSTGETMLVKLELPNMT